MYFRTKMNFSGKEYKRKLFLDGILPMDMFYFEQKYCTTSNYEMALYRAPPTSGFE
jgi:hypothetical protein